MPGIQNLTSSGRNAREMNKFVQVVRNGKTYSAIIVSGVMTASLDAGDYLAVRNETNSALLKAEVYQATASNLKVTDIGGGGGIAGSTDVYKSPEDCSIAWTSGSALAQTGLSYEPASEQLLKVTEILSGGIATVYSPTTTPMSYASGVVTVPNAGFVSTSTFIVEFAGSVKALNKPIDAYQHERLNPESANYFPESLVDTTNVATGSAYYPSSTGAALGGKKDLSFTGKFIDADGTVTMSVEMMNDEDTASGDFVRVYGYDDKNNVTVNNWKVTNGTLTFACSFNNVNFDRYRVLIENGGNSNTNIVKSRQKAL